MKIIQSYERFIPAIGGAETYIANLVENMQDTDFEIVTYLLPDTQENETYSKNCTILRIKPVVEIPKTKLGVGKEILKDIIRARRVNTYLKKSSADIIHIHAPSMLSWLFWLDKKIFWSLLLSRPLLYKKFKKPVVLTIHQLYYQSYEIPFENDRFRHKIFRKIIDVSDAIIAVENYSYDYLNSYLKKHNIKKKLYKIHNSVNTKTFEFKHNKIRKKLKLLYVGRITSEKGIDFLIDFIKKMPDYIEFNIVGSGPKEDLNLFKEIMTKNVNVLLHKNISFKNLVNLYQNCNLVLNPVKFQAITRVTLEAMSCGRPVIMISRGNRYPVIHGKTGYLIEEDIDSLLNLINKINKNRKQLIEFGKNARKIIEQEFSNEVIIPKIKKVYEDSIKNGKKV